MAFFDSSISYFELDRSQGGAVTDLSPYITDVDGLPGALNLNDVTPIGATSESTHPGIKSASIALSGNWDDSATTGLDAVIGAVYAAGQTATLTFGYGPEGGTGGDTKYSGECWIESYSVKSSVGNQVTFSATLRVSGAVARGTF